MTKSRLFISVELLQLIDDSEVEWKRINETWLIEQEKKDRKKKPRLEKSVEEEENDDLEFVVNKFDDDEDDFISFEDENENENENASHARHAKHAKHDNLRTNHSIDNEFNPRDFFDDMNDERAFETLYN
jgi:hypothetical protein